MPLIWIGLAAALILLPIAGLVYVGLYLQWVERQTAGMAYYGRPLEARRALKRRIRLLSLPARPFVHLLARLGRARAVMPTFEFERVSGPPKVSSPEVFARARAYQPAPDDVFVVTQMRCGTTWMQQVVYEILTRGRAGADGADGAERAHLYAESPWIDAVNSVDIDAAPRLGQPPSRIIKCHLPTELCPYSPAAKYIYVARHPVSCFASIVDFNRSMLGPFLPPIGTMAEWFCSERMYWRPWPAHVAGWWQWAATRDNVLFIHFEDMKRDFGAVLDRVAQFLGCTLTAEERALVAGHCSFAYMKDHEEFFEMAPPTMFSVAGGEFLASGGAARHDDVTPDVRRRIEAYCRASLAGTSYPAGRFYPDLAAPPVPQAPAP